MKLPKPRKRGESYRIEIMIDGKRLSATRDTAKECTQWAMQKLVESKTQEKLDRQDTITVNELLNLFLSHKKEYQTGKVVARTFKRDFPHLGEMQVHEITPKHLTDWRNERLKHVTDGTVRREISFLSSAFSHAVKELFLIESNPFFQLTKPPMPKARNRRITDDEINLLIKTSGYQLGQKPTQARHFVMWAFLFAIETAMRRGEILGLTVDNIKDGYVHLPKTKNGSSRDVPLTAKAREMLTWLDDDVLNITENSFRLSWQRLVKASGIDDLNFHDTRHEAISRFVARGVPVEKLMKISGHKDAKTLINVYYNPHIDELIDLVN